MSTAGLIFPTLIPIGTAVAVICDRLAKLAGRDIDIEAAARRSQHRLAAARAGLDERS